MTLDMFMTDNFTPMTDSHVECLRREWKKMTPDKKLHEFNREWYTRYFTEECNRQHLEYLAGLEVPYYSGWASKVLAVKYPI